MTHAVIFDLDGTLLNSSTQDEALYKKAVERVLGSVRFRPGLGDYDHVTDAGILLQVLDDNDVAADRGAIAAVRNEFCVLLEDHVAASGPFQEVPGARAILQRLGASGDYRIAIATGGWKRSAKYKLRTAGFEITGVPLATSDDAMDRTEIMRMALQSIDAECRIVTYYGDGPWDQQACRELGWTFRPVGPALHGISTFADEFLS